MTKFDAALLCCVFAFALACAIAALCECNRNQWSE
jgi:hypothetical protein